MILRTFMCLAVFLLAMINAPAGWAQAESPDALVKRVSTDVLAAVNADPSIQAGDVNKIVALVDVKVLPLLNFERMTATAAGPHWREATPDQRKALQEEFKTLLVRVYSGALARSKDRTIEVRPMREAASKSEVVVRTEVRGGGDPVALDFRLESAGSSWKIHDLNVGGVWLVENYRGSFAQAIATGGIDGLIAALRAKNKAAARN